MKPCYYIRLKSPSTRYSHTLPLCATVRIRDALLSESTFCDRVTVQPLLSDSYRLNPRRATVRILLSESVTRYSPNLPIRDRTTARILPSESVTCYCLDIPIRDRATVRIRPANRKPIRQKCRNRHCCHRPQEYPSLLLSLLKLLPLSHQSVSPSVRPSV